MDIIMVNTYNVKDAYKAFTTGKLAVTFYANNRYGVIQYDDTARTGANGEYKWSVCAFGNMLIELLNTKVINEIYIINPLRKNIFNTYDEMVQVVKKNATHVIVRE